MKTVSKNLNPAQPVVDDIKIKRNVSLLFPALIYLPFVALLSLFFRFCMAWRLPLGVVKSKCIWVIKCKINYQHCFHLIDKSSHIFNMFYIITQVILAF